MSSKARILLRTHFRIVKNWTTSGANFLFLALVVSVSILVLVLFKQRLARNADNVVVQVCAAFAIVLVPGVLSKIYLNLLRRENGMLLTMMSGGELAGIRRVQAVSSCVVLFLVLSGVGLYPRIEEFPSLFYIPAGILLLALIGLSLGYGGSRKKQTSLVIERNRMRALDWTRGKASPVRAILCRDMLSVWRKKRIQLFLYVLSLLAINALCIAFSIKNDIAHLYIGSFAVQAVMIIDVALNFSIEDDRTLLAVNDSYAHDLYRSKVLSWIVACSLYFCVLIPVHYIFLPGVSTIFIACFCASLYLLLAYALLVRIACCESDIVRNVVFALSVAVPVAIPFVVYRFHRRI